MFRICSFFTLLCLSTSIATGYTAYPDGTDSNTLNGLDLEEDLLLKRLLEESDNEVDAQLKRNEQKPGNQGSVNGFNFNSLNTEEDIENFIERKMAEVYEKKIKDFERKSILRDQILQERARKLKKRVSFSTQLTEAIKDIRIAQKIIFDRVDINDGNGYSIESGIFRAPRSGVYMFAYFVAHGAEPGQAWLQLMHNGKKINAAVVDTFNKNQDTQGGNFAIVNLKGGDSVWLESWHADHSYLGGNRYGFTTFSGALLY